MRAILTAADYALLFGAGLAGSLHCAGMCGGFVLALGGAPGARRRFALAQGLFHGGKAFTYAFLGALAGALGASLHAAGALARAQEALALVSGAILVAVGARLLGAWPRGPKLLRPRSAGVTPSALLLRPALAAVGRATPFATGLFAGFIPCGLVYAAAARAAETASAAEGAAVMAVFAAGTAPALVAVAVFGSMVPARWRARLSSVSGGLVIAVGLVAIARGALALAAGRPDACPACG